MKQDFQTELMAQQSAVFTYRALHVAAGIMWLLIGWNGHGLVMLAAFTIQGFVHLMKWPVIRDELERRKKIVAFKTQIENLYVFSIGPEHDPVIAKTFEDTLEMLRQSGNEHEVRVHLALFRDVAVFTSYFDTNGRRHDDRSWREAGAASETWEEYEFWRDEFYRADRDKRLRQLRTDQRGFEWVNRHYFNQAYEPAG